MQNTYILSIDQGTSSTKTIIFNNEGQAVSRAAEPLKTYYLPGGLVEQEPEEIYRNILISIEKCLALFRTLGGNPAQIAVAGISNQRETFVIWDKAGKPLYNAIVWQCKRSVQICERLRSEGLQETIKAKTGLIIDPYFSGSKLIWLYENVDKVRKAIDAGEAYFGTIDTWLLFKLTNGQKYLTDYTNASRTLFFNLHELQWDRELLRTFGLSCLNLPEAKPSSFVFGQADFEGLLQRPVNIGSMIGDSHSAAFGEGCYSPGTAKATLGTGCSILMNVGSELKDSKNGMVSTICWSTEERVDYALEGVIVSCGATIEWLKNNLGLFSESKETEAMATSVNDNGGVYLVPAFSGLGGPYWDMTRKASITGLTFDSTLKHVVRAALESIPYQIKDVIVAMESDSEIHLKELMADGGMTSNEFVLQFLSDLLEKQVVNIGIPDVSALGAALLAGLKAGIFKDIDHLSRLNTEKKIIVPHLNSEVKKWYSGWLETIKNSAGKNIPANLV